jgi:hypothetical protein
VRERESRNPSAISIEGAELDERRQLGHRASVDEFASPLLEVFAFAGDGAAREIERRRFAKKGSCDEPRSIRCRRCGTVGRWRRPTLPSHASSLRYHCDAAKIAITHTGPSIASDMLRRPAITTPLLPLLTSVLLRHVRSASIMRTAQPGLLVAQFDTYLSATAISAMASK